MSDLFDIGYRDFEYEFWAANGSVIRCAGLTRKRTREEAERAIRDLIERSGHRLVGDLEIVER